MRILSIETSCDETAAAVVEDGIFVRSNVIASSQDVFTKAGGVIPEEAARRQVECILPVIEQAIDGIGLTPKDIDAIAVTRGPGLLGSLLVGTTTARVLSSMWKIPVVGIHHTLGHLSSTWLVNETQDSRRMTKESEPIFPILTLSASGGHTELWLRTAHTKGTLHGRTRDDAAGEAFDKGASLLGLPYPGGPAIAKLADEGDEHVYDFPLPLAKEDTLDFSFSGLKTSLRYLLRDLAHDNHPAATIPESSLRNIDIKHIAASYQRALCAHLVDRIRHALDQHPEIREVHLVGGVSANRRLRTMAAQVCGDRTLRFPVKISYCTDNAAMIGAAAEFLIKERGMSNEVWNTEGSLPLASAIKE